MKRTTIGFDLAKRVFQLHSVDPDTGEISQQTLKRSQVLRHFAKRQPSVVAMEACGSAHYWARELAKLGHEVRLIAAQFVRPFVKGNKTDAADAQAIWEAAQRPGMRFVAVKSEEQQGTLAIHRVRETLVGQKTQLINALRAHLAEFGIPGRRQGFAADRRGRRPGGYAGSRPGPERSPGSRRLAARHGTPGRGP